MGVHPCPALAVALWAVATPAAFCAVVRAPVASARGDVAGFVSATRGFFVRSNLQPSLRPLIVNAMPLDHPEVREELQRFVRGAARDLVAAELHALADGRRLSAESRAALARKLVVMRDYYAPLLPDYQRRAVEVSAGRVSASLPMREKKALGRLMLSMARELLPRRDAPAAEGGVLAAPPPGGAPRPSGLSRPGRREAAVRKRLAKLEVVRLVITPSPGLGHQSLAGVAERGLRRLGFDGYFDVVIPDERVDGKAGLMLSARSRHNVTRKAQGGVDLAILPGLDGQVDGGVVRAANAAALLPFLWIPKLRWSWGAFTPVHTLERTRGFLYDLPAPRDSPAFVRANMGSRLDHERLSPALEAAAKRFGEAELLPVYGMSLLMGQALEGLVRGVRHAQWKGGLGTVIMPVFSKPPARILERLAQAVRADPDLAGRVLIVDARAPAAATTVRDAPPGAIVLLLAGPVPQPVFELFYARATLPPTVAGSNAQNLMALLGRPYLMTVAKGEWWRMSPAFEEALEADPAAKRLLERAHAALHSARPESPEAAEAIGDYLFAGRDPSSTLSRVFASQRLADPEEDRLVTLLHALFERTPLGLLRRLQSFYERIVLAS